MTASGDSRHFGCRTGQTFASPFRAPVSRRSREPSLVTHSGRVAPHNTSARSRACWMMGFAIPMPEGSNPRGKGIGRGAKSAVARLRRSWPTRGGAVWESGERRAGRIASKGWSLAPGSVRLSQKSHKVAVLLGITMLSALSLPDRREGGSGGSRYRRPLEFSSGGSSSPEARRCGRTHNSRL